MSEQQFRMESIEREPAWLTAAIDQDIQRIKATLFYAKATLPETDVIMLMLNEHETVGMSEAQFMEWNEMCDGCRKQFPRAEGLLYCNVLRDWNDRSKVCITFAACLDCLAKP